MADKTETPAEPTRQGPNAAGPGGAPGALPADARERLSRSRDAPAAVQRPSKAARPRGAPRRSSMAKPRIRDAPAPQAA